jgi:CheY-like chemotaxis protein
MSMGWNGLDGTSADLLTNEAVNYLRRQADYVRTMDPNNIVWDCVDGKLVDSAIPPALYGSEMARRSSLRAVGARADNPRALGLLAMAHCEAHSLLPGLTEEERKALADKAPALDEELRLCGPAALTTALAMALDANDANLSIELLREIAAVTTPGSPVPVQVSAGLRAKSREVRLRAAVTACQIDPNQGSNPETAKLLADAVGEKVQRIALIVDELTERRLAFTGAFEKARWFAAPCDSALSGLARVRRFSGTDLIVVSASLRDLVAEQVIDELKADDRTKNVPIVVVAAESAVEGAKTRFGANVKSVVAKFDSAAMDALVDGAPMNPERQRAEQLASDAAKALGHAPTMGDAAREASLAALAEAALGRADVVRIPALRALARFGGVNQESAIAAVLTDATATPAAKAAACDAFAGIGSRGGSLSIETQKTLDAALADADAGVRAAAANAIGRSPNFDAAARARALAAKATSLSAFGPAPKPAEAAPAPAGEQQN